MVAPLQSKQTRDSQVVFDDREALTSVLLVAGSAVEERTLADSTIIPLGDRLTIGRADGPPPSLVLPAFEVSQQHAQINTTESGYRLVDLGSTNGTYVDNLRVRNSVPLASGSIVAIGPYAFVFRRLSAEELAAICEDRDSPFCPVATLNPACATLNQRMRLLARSNVDLLLSGETGVGKEVYAEAIHRVSDRKGAFVPINCAALPDYLVESELFGFVRGAHSTATETKAGLFELAAGGTLFLDELGDMPRQAQAKLLRFLQDRRFIPLGSTRARSVDVRVIAATRRTVPEDPDKSDTGIRFDLAMRLGPEPLRIPKLSERIEDVGVLAWHFVRGKRTSFTSEAFRALFLHSWPGNIRELEKVMQIALALSDEEEPLGIDHLPESMLAHGRDGTASSSPSVEPGCEERRPATAPPTRAELEFLLDRFHGDVAEVARRLHRQRTLVWRWLRKHGCDPGRYRSGASSMQSPSASS